ncbi:MAG: TIGR00730 family Rossman fold protein [Actinomycetota bacterium]
MPPYELGDPTLDRQIARLVAAAAPEGGGLPPDAHLAEEIIVTALRLLRDRADRADLRLINTALKEMRYAFMVFSRYRGVRKAAVFGSARTPASDPNYALAEALAAHLAWERGWMVMTGAGPGIMEAANKGAGERSFGINIRLPFEDDTNPYIPPDRVINFKYFFPRKLTFVKESHAFVLFPGGFGTLDETLETLTLMQTGKSDLHPVVLMEAPGTGYWQEWLDFVRNTLVRQGMIADDDLALVRFTHEVAEAGDEITRFYANYHSQRYVDGHLVLRLLHSPTPEQVALLNDLFSDILVGGVIEAIAATPTEAEDGDHPDLPRLRLPFNRRSLGRLRALIDHLNSLAP